MNDPFFTQFAEACGATGPLDLRVDLADGGTLAEGSIPMPFVLVGRDDGCDVTLAEPEINPRHAWLQVIAGRVFAVDLGSRTGLGWPGGATGSGWMDENTPVKVGPFQLRLRSPVSGRPPFPPGYNPLYSDSAGVRNRPRVALEFRNGKRVKDRWAVNRYITLIGRAPECKIHLTSDDIATYHCGLVLTTTGLWVVDLSGRGVVVNGERMRLSPLGHAAELWVGRFLIGVQAPGNPHLPNPGRSGVLSGTTSRSGLSLSSTDGQGSSRGTPVVRKGNPADDEVALGAAPAVDSSGGFSSSQVGESFRMRVSTVGTSGPVSQQIQVTNSGAVPQLKNAPARPTPRATPIVDPNLDLFSSLTPGSGVRAVPEALLSGVPTAEATPEQLARQLADLHSLMLTQAQQSLVLMVQLISALQPAQLPAIQKELARVNHLNAELVHLQTEVTRRAAEVPALAAAGAGSGDVIPMAIPVATADQPAGDTSPTSPTALQDWVVQRMNALQRERSIRWSAFIGAVRAK
ncbi:fha domain-containing protein : FHA domain-containing protein OS=Singulisphaera acidiphila (strain ATCC BAA-1392 / DSM 18658 / VKM B-2454 / MOB10) GN=Sinac_5475 PE=4 SV=1: FHA: FHA [Gemmataceae bacterium]|nr:fha domain-containing protein : FHA domain-containing protein OS=Singulisphaera acidiphila (strain ATCC BAA-1392 / DSM 18658 / VKM B-2454 / MOB10) GN=Sinac_5475 PE=4 SV=1: FHA: FHA [Gemmataceae bacterium]VTU02797.1 fha domain-containing protein : FHA domain-containing protein OS=Singulisphaera acidiphila (strain ATCC BAA-1392 / DSM 18658 / VKM B-2454 / MOB10) GN=Sinac_5475 PE=4 SV=1: FHA: FHA [Gemmataceae bacterium]